MADPCLCVSITDTRMKNLIIYMLCCLPMVHCPGPQQSGGGTAGEEKEAPEYCELRGNVYVESAGAFADYRVYVEPVESFANMLIYREPIAGFATDQGQWHFTTVRAFADFTVFIEETEAFTDFTINYTDFKTRAGCQ